MIAEKGWLDVTTSDLKYTGNKFGKKMFEEEILGKGYDIFISDAKDEIEYEMKPKKVTTKKKLEPIQETLLKEEEIITHDQKKIKLSRLDLFDEDE